MPSISRKVHHHSPGRDLYCGDFRKVLANMSPVDLVMTSPPYNIGSKSERQVGRRRLGMYDTKSFGGVRSYHDSMPEADYQQSQKDALKWMAAHIKTTGTVVYNHKPRHKAGVLIKPESWFPNELVQVDEVVWDRGSTHNHNTSFVYQHTERLYVLAHPDSRRTFKNDGSSDVWHIGRARSNGSTHDARYPLELARKCIRLWSNPGDTVCDPYSGSGTTMIAAILEGRKFVGAEMLKKHFEESERSYQEACGSRRRHMETANVGRSCDV